VYAPNGYLSLVPGTGALAPFLTVLALQWIVRMNADGTGDLAHRYRGVLLDRWLERPPRPRELLRVARFSTDAWLVGGAGLLVGGGPVWRPLHILALGFAALPVWWQAFRDEPAAAEAVDSPDRSS